MSANAIYHEILDLKRRLEGIAPSLYGMPISVSSMLPMKRQCRRLQIKPWHRHMQCCYYERINKKWAKRFGFEMIHCIQAGEKIFLAAEMYQRVRETVPDADERIAH